MSRICGKKTMCADSVSCYGAIKNFSPRPCSFKSNCCPVAPRNYIDKRRNRSSVKFDHRICPGRIYKNTSPSLDIRSIEYCGAACYRQGSRDRWRIREKRYIFIIKAISAAKSSIRCLYLAAVGCGPRS